MEGTSDDVDDRRRVSSKIRRWKSEAPWETSWAQLPGEYSCKGKPKGYSIDLSHNDSGEESAGREGGVAAENGEKTPNWKKEQVTIDCEGSKTLRMHLNQVLLFYGRLYNLIIYIFYAEFSLRHCIFIIVYQNTSKDFCIKYYTMLWSILRQSACEIQKKKSIS